MDLKPSELMQIEVSVAYAKNKQMYVFIVVP